jgi:hypothetical protein
MQARLLRSALAFAIALFSTQCGDVRAAPPPPDLDLVTPPHFTRGKTTLVRCAGRNFGTAAKLLLPFPAEVREASSADNIATFSVTPTATAPLGSHPVRIIAAGGVSNLRLVALSDLPVVMEQEPNDTFESAQKLAVPTVVTGPLNHPARDIETFRFTATAGERLTIMTQTRSLGLSPDLRISLYDSHRKQLASAEGTPGLLEDERIDFTFPASGEYFIKLHDADYENIGWTNDYTLVVARMNYVRSVYPLGGRRGEPLSIALIDRDGKKSVVETKVPAEPNASDWKLALDSYPGSLPWPMASGEHREVFEDRLSAVMLDAGEVSENERSTDWPITVNGRIAVPDEQDAFRIIVKPGQKIRAMVDAFYRCSSLDGHLLVYDPLGKKLIAENNDMHLRGNVDPGVTFEVPAGVTSIVVSLRDVFGRGGTEYPYRLTIEVGGPDFILSLGNESHRALNDKARLYDHADTLNLRPGVPTKLPVSVARAKEDAPYNFGPMAGFQGPITVRAIDAPPGITVEPVVIAAGKTSGELIATAAPGAPRGPFELTIVGEATRDDGSKIRHVAERRLFLCEPAFGNMKWNHVSRKVVGLVLEPDAGSKGDAQ